MKVRPYERSTLWRSAFAKRRNDPDERDREALAEAYRQLRDRAGVLVGEIHTALPQLTVHDLTHADTLWDVASEICGPNFRLNPLEGFVLGASFLLHDAGMALAAYPNGITELKSSLEWRDALVSAWKKRGVEEPSDAQRNNPETDISDEATFQVLRARHASQALTLATALWTLPSTGRPLALVQNDDLLESYGLLIGNISASHHWPLPEIARYFGDSTPASAAWPRDWDVDGLLLACILRCADACAIDETRAPSFLFAIRKPKGLSKRHWNFQNKIYPAKRRDDSLVFESKSNFPPHESDDWWLCFDAIELADRELRGSDALLTDRKRRPLIVRRAAGAGDPEILAKSVKVSGWRPVNTLPKISDPGGIIERLGGKQLYGDNPLVPIRELIQNSVDAVRARRFVDSHFTKEDEQYPGQILVAFERIPETKSYWIIVEDNGVGMSEKTITRSLLDFGTSFWSSAAAAQLYPGLPSEKKFKPVGRFGIGFFSVFMYSEVVVVISKEFRGGLDTWNRVSFQHGVRGRGDLSIESTPQEVVLSNTSTRIKVQVTEEFLRSLAELSWVQLEDDKDDELLTKSIVSRLTELVCALDVKVRLILNGRSFQLNEPLIYQKGLNAISSVVWPDNEAVDLRQRDMLCPLGFGPDQYYGFCGLNLGRYYAPAHKSVGGIVIRQRHSGSDPIVGIAEYAVSAASRTPSRLAVPDDVMHFWVKEQIGLVLSRKLTDQQREYAASNLGRLINDVRPIFYVITSEGGMNLDTLIAAIRDMGRLTIPVFSYRLASSHMQFSGVMLQLPIPDQEFTGDFYFDLADLSFDGLTIFSSLLVNSLVVSETPDSRLIPRVTPNQYNSFWPVVINTLIDLNIKFEFTFISQYKVGSYKGLDSPKHNLKAGDAVLFDVIQISAA